MAGLLNMAGLSLTGAFNGTQLRAPTPAARVSHTGFSVVAVSAATARARDVAISRRDAAGTDNARHDARRPRG